MPTNSSNNIYRINATQVEISIYGAVTSCPCDLNILWAGLCNWMGVVDLIPYVLTVYMRESRPRIFTDQTWGEQSIRVYIVLISFTMFSQFAQTTALQFWGISSTEAPICLCGKTLWLTVWISNQISSRGGPVLLFVCSTNQELEKAGSRL